MPAGVLTPARVNLPQVTLVAVTSVAHEATLRAIERCTAQADFAAVLFISDRLPPRASTPAVTWHQIAPLASREAYSHFLLTELHNHVKTSHALCIQWDSWILEGAQWREEFLVYDYIGAPWPHIQGPQAVGNGGFSLRSHRLLAACAQLGFFHDEAEDLAICRTHRQELESHFGVVFAPEDLARRFAYERYAPSGNEFGFHGAFNMLHLMSDEDLAETLGGLEPVILNRREHRELLRRALLSGRWRVAVKVLQRLRSGGLRRR